MKQRVIIFTTAYFPLTGGAEVAIKELTNRLPDWDFDLVCAKIQPGLVSTEQIGRVMVHRCGFGVRFDKFLLPFWGAWRALSLARRQNVAFIWSMMASYGGFAALFFTWFKPRTKFLLTIQEGDPPERYSQRAGMFAGLFRSVFRRADEVQVISHFLGGWAKQMGARVEPVVIPNGVDVTLFTKPITPERRREIRKNFGFHESDCVLVTVSRLSLKNGIDDLVRSVSFLPDGTKVLLIGEGEDRTKIEQLVQELHLGSRVVFTGNRPHVEVAEFLRASDVFVRPSLSEGLGNSFLEAMAAGLPIVGTLVGGIPDFLTDGETGVACEPRNPKSIAEAVSRIVDHPEVRERVIQNGVQLVVGRYDWKHIGEGFQHLCTSFLLKKRIVLATGIYPPETGGPATYAKSFAEECLAQGHDARVITYGDASTVRDFRFPVDVVSRDGGRLVRYVRYAWRVWVVARSSDVVYTQGAVSEGLPATIGAWCARRPVVMRVPGDYAWEMHQQRVPNGELLEEFVLHLHGGIIGVYEYIERWTARHAARVIVPSRFLAHVVRAWGVLEDRTHIVQSTIVPLPETRSREDVRRDFGCVALDVVLLTNVRAVPWKGVDFLIDLFPRLPPNRVLIVIGEGPQLAVWQKKVKDAGLEKRIRFVGRVSRSEVASWCAAADVFVLASGYEGYPHVVVEAVSAGLPCLVSDRAGNPETQESYPSYVTVLPYRDADAWVAELSRDHARLLPATIPSFSSAAQTVLRNFIDLCAS